MRICVLYTRIIKNSDPRWVAPLPYDKSAVRFLETYRAFTPKIPHELIVANCGGDGDSLFDDVATRFVRDDSTGYDCGTFREVGAKLDCDFVLGLNSHTHFYRHGWLEKFSEAFSLFGEGIYGASGSYERNRHIRMPAIAFTPKIMRDYPEKIDTRQKAEEFEGGPNNLSIWAQSQGYPTTVVAVDGFYSLNRVRAIERGFRRGDQSNMLIRDRHVTVYDESTPEYRAHLESVTYDSAPAII